MSIELTTVLMFASLIVFLLLGLPLAFTLGGIAVVFTLLLWGPDGLYMMGLITLDRLTNFVLLALPLFIFMANMLERSGIADDLYGMMHRWLGALGGSPALISS